MSTHLERTAKEPRAPHDPHPATIKELWQITPSIRGVRLLVNSADKTDGDVDTTFGFEAGQWVDFIIPNSNMVGGYSMISLPDELPFLDLAVKARLPDSTIQIV